MNASRPLSNERGSATLEQMFSMGTIIGLVAALLLLASMGVSKIWLRYAGNEAAICLASDSTQTQCEQDFRDRTEILERIGHMKNFQLSVTPAEATVQWDFEVKGYKDIKFDLNGKINMPLPLQS